MGRPRKHDPSIAALRDLILAVEHYRQAVSHHLELGVTETQALSNLVASGAMGQTELADALGITTSSVTSLVDRMEAAGLVKRQPHPHDRRRTVVQLTKYGDESVERTRGWIIHAFDGIPDTELDAAAHLLRTVAVNMRTASDQIP